MDNFFDIVFCIIAGGFVVLGLRRGLVEEIVRVAAVIAGFVVACLWYRPAASMLSFLPVPHFAHTLTAFLGLFAAAMIAVLVLGKMVKTVIHLTVLAWVDRLGGAAIGMAKALLFTYMFILTFSVLPFADARNVLNDSIVYSLLSRIPFSLHVPRLGRAGESVKNLLAAPPVKRLNRAKERFEEFREKVDSAKLLHDTHTAKDPPAQ